MRYESQAAKWAAACARSTFWNVIAMSYPHWESVPCNQYRPPRHDSTNGALRDSTSHVQSADKSIDAALRSVPLPDGLLTRLDKFVLSMSDGATDSVDYLGC